MTARFQPSGVVGFQLPSDRGARRATGVGHHACSGSARFTIRDQSRVNETHFPTPSHPRPDSTLGPTMSRPPGGVCATGDRRPATKWVGRIDTLSDGRVIRRGVGVCEECYERLTSDNPLAAAEMQRLIGGG